MPRFHFPLQQLLDLKASSEKQSQCELAATERMVYREQTRLEELGRSCEEAQQVTAAVPGQPVQVDNLLSNGLHLARLRVQKAAQEARVRQWSDQEQAHRHELIRVSRERQMVERLKERRHEEYQRRVDHVERRTLDEAAVMGFVRQRMEWQPPSAAD